LELSLDPLATFVPEWVSNLSSLRSLRIVNPFRLHTGTPPVFGGKLPCCDTLVVYGGAYFTAKAWPLRTGGRLVFPIVSHDSGASYEEFVEWIRLIGDDTIELVILLTPVGKDETRLPSWRTGVLHRLGMALGRLDRIPEHLRITIVNGDRLSRNWRRSIDETLEWAIGHVRGGIEKWILPDNNGTPTAEERLNGTPTAEERLALIDVETLDSYFHRVGSRQYEFEIARRRGWCR
jgi:hypothetical protein